MSEVINCTSPESVQETDYLAFINADGRPEFIVHLTTCCYCQAQVAEFQRSENLLRQNLRFISGYERLFCSEPYQLSQYLLNSLTDLEQRRITAHLQACGYCREEILSLQSWLPNPDPLILEMLPTDATGCISQMPLMRRLLANLMQGTTSLRGTPDGTPQIFQVEDVQITLMVQPAGSRRSDLIIEGLVQRELWELEQLQGVEVRLLKDVTPVACVQIDDIGNFIFENVAAAPLFSLEIHFSDKIIVVLEIKGD